MIILFIATYLEVDDSEIQKMVNSRMKKKIQADPIVRQNKSFLLLLQDKLKRLVSRQDNLRSKYNIVYIRKTINRAQFHKQKHKISAP